MIVYVQFIHLHLHNMSLTAILKPVATQVLEETDPAGGSARCQQAPAATSHMNPTINKGD